MKNKNSALTISIIFASVVISGSLVFFGVQITGGEEPSISDVQIEEQIENYIEKKQDEQVELAEKELLAKNEQAKNVKTVSESDDHIRGDKNARISLIEYSDFECPYCKSFHPTAQQVVDEYDGEVNWIYRHFPLSFHDPLATKEAIATECANELGGNEKFWEMADLIFDRTGSNGKGLDINNLTELAIEIGLDERAFDTCMESGKYDQHIAQDIEEGDAAGVTGTPGNILLNNETGDTVLVPGAQPFNKLQIAIDQMLNS